jgi:hypothetical protein
MWQTVIFVLHTPFRPILTPCWCDQSGRVSFRRMYFERTSLWPSYESSSQSNILEHTQLMQHAYCQQAYCQDQAGSPSYQLLALANYWEFLIGQLNKSAQIHPSGSPFCVLKSEFPGVAVWWRLCSSHVLVIRLHSMTAIGDYVREKKCMCQVGKVNKTCIEHT